MFIRRETRQYIHKKAAQVDSLLKCCEQLKSDVDRTNESLHKARNDFSRHLLECDLLIAELQNQLSALAARSGLEFYLVPAVPERVTVLPAEPERWTVRKRASGANS